MPTYQFLNSRLGGVANVCRLSDMAFIPFDMGNKDCVQFITDWKAGATVLDANGVAQPYTDAAVIALGLTPPA